jgi:hypothetical protein
MKGAGQIRLDPQPAQNALYAREGQYHQHDQGNEHDFPQKFPEAVSGGAIRGDLGGLSMGLMIKKTPRRKVIRATGNMTAIKRQISTCRSSTASTKPG